MNKLIFEGFEDEIVSIPVSNEEANMLIDSNQTITNEKINEIPIINDLLVRELDIYTYVSQLLDDVNIDEDTKLRLRSISEDTANIVGKLQYNLKETDANISEGEDEMSETVD